MFTIIDDGTAHELDANIDNGRVVLSHEALVAPDFALPDLAGRVHRLSEHRGKKVLLVAYASW